MFSLSKIIHAYGLSGEIMGRWGCTVWTIQKYTHNKVKASPLSIIHSP